jgi:nucleotide-binding universal stress UspA family protein
MATGLASNFIQNPSGEEPEYRLKKIMVAHDASPKSHLALEDAVALARRFQSEIVLAYVQPPLEEEGAESIENLQGDAKARRDDIASITNQLGSTGLHARGVLRGGIVGDTLFNIACDEDADLLLLGAYGYGTQDRHTLGSTTEHLLRAVPCPTLTYGPNVASSMLSANHNGPVLVPISLPCSCDQLRRAIAIARLLGIHLELLHVMNVSNSQDMRAVERECERLTELVRQNGLHVQWSVLSGTPEEVIRARGSELDSPFILMPLKWGKSLSSITSDNVAAFVIRESRIPVMTYRLHETV